MNLPPVPRDEAARLRWLEEFVNLLGEELNEINRQIESLKERVTALETP